MFEPNAPAHRERPSRGLSDSSESPAGHDAVARRVRVVFAPRVFPHSVLLLILLLPLRLSLRAFAPSLETLTVFLPLRLHSVPSFSVAVRAQGWWCLSLRGSLVGFRLPLLFCNPPGVHCDCLLGSSLTLPITCRRPNDTFHVQQNPQAGGGQVQRRVRFARPAKGKESHLRGATFPLQ